MSDEGEKAFEATPQRLRKAKRDGNVARSSELGGNLSFAGAAASVVLVAPSLGALVAHAIVSGASGHADVSGCAAAFACALVPIGAAVLAGAAATAFQSGGFTFTPVAIKLERLNPAEGMRRMLSRETLAHTLRSFAAFVVATGAMISALIGACTQLLEANALPAVAATAWQTAQHVAWAACATGTVFAVADFAAARGAWLRKLRMSFDERKREAKEQDGDPVTRGRRRALHRSLLRGALANVRRASFVVANPTHVAVALEYRPPDVPVPRILVAAADAAAARVRELAAEYRIPIVENVELARALYRDARVGESIAFAHYVAVAEIVAALMRENKTRA